MESYHTAEIDIPELNADASTSDVSLEWPITLYFQLYNYVMKAT
jgi:hypothetical protein